MTKLSPNGTIIASFDEDGRLILWNVATGLPLEPPLTQHSKIEDLDFTPDGRILAASDDTTVVLWDVATRQRLVSLKGHDSPVLEVEFSPDGKILRSADGNGIMILWDVGTHERLGSLDHGGIPGPVTARFSPDGKVLVSGNRVLVSGKQEGTLVLWDVRTRQASEPAIAPFASADRIRFSPDGRVLAVWGAGKITFYDISTHQFLGSKDGVALSKDFKTVASVDNDGVFLHDVSFLADASRESWRARACAIANRNLTRTEWKFYLGRHAIVQPYRATCPDLPEGEDTPAAGVRCP